VSVLKDMYEDGYTTIANVDISKVVVEQMSEKYQGEWRVRVRVRVTVSVRVRVRVSLGVFFCSRYSKTHGVLPVFLIPCLHASCTCTLTTALPFPFPSLPFPSLPFPLPSLPFLATSRRQARNDLATDEHDIAGVS
jgi:hypothetical protein